MIRFARKATLALCMLILPTVSIGAPVKTAYTPDDIAAFTQSHTPFKLASKRDWLLHDPQINRFHTKLLHNDPSLEHDAKFQALKTESLKSRESFYNTSMHITATKNMIDQKGHELATKVGNMIAENNKSIDFAFAAMAKYRRSFENGFKHDKIIDAVDAMLDTNLYDDPESCRDLALSFIKAKKLLYGLYQHQLKLYKAGKHKSKAREHLDKSILESDIASMDYTAYNLNSSLEPNHKKIPAEDEKNWLYCARVAFKVRNDATKLRNYLLYVRNTIYGKPINNKQVAAYLNN